MRGFMGVIHYIASLARALFILGIALFLPQICLWNSQQLQKETPAPSSNPFRLGIENVAQGNFYNLQAKDLGHRIALVTNDGGINQENSNTIKILSNKGLEVKKILACQSILEKKIKTKNNQSIPIISLQTKNKTHIIPKELMSNVDTIMVDIQDTGMQYAAGSNILLDVMKAADAYKKKCIILDRPNLLGWCMEGICPEIPLRYGMTIGERARYYNQYVLRKPINLTVIPMSNYNRCVESGSALDSALSNQLKNIDSCYGYSFLGLLDHVAPFDIGLDTDKAFQCILLPDKMKIPKHTWLELATFLKDLGVASKEHRYYNVRKKTHFSGLRIHIQDINHFSSFKTLLTLLNFFKRNGVPLQFSPSFDKTLGSTTMKSLIQGTITKAEFAQQVNSDLQLFFKKACSCFLYKPYPKIVHV
jgi:uncharacterized protein YbbC (DUF1343 family)